jgi:hypothetical protein
MPQRRKRRWRRLGRSGDEIDVDRDDSFTCGSLEVDTSAEHADSGGVNRDVKSIGGLLDVDPVM